MHHRTIYLGLANIGSLGLYVSSLAFEEVKLEKSKVPEKCIDFSLEIEVLRQAFTLFHRYQQRNVIWLETLFDIRKKKGFEKRANSQCCCQFIYFMQVIIKLWSVIQHLILKIKLNKGNLNNLRNTPNFSHPNTVPSNEKIQV